MPSDRIRSLVDAVKADPALIKVLRDDPTSLAKKFELSQDELATLKRADLLLLRENPLLGTTTLTFVTGSTVTGGGVVDPQSLVELSQGQLIRLLERVLVDRERALRVRNFLRL